MPFPLTAFCQAKFSLENTWCWASLYRVIFHKHVSSETTVTVALNRLTWSSGWNYSVVAVLFQPFIWLRARRDKLKGEFDPEDSDSLTASLTCSVSRGCRINRLLLCRGVRPPPNDYPWYDTKQSDGEVLIMLKLWRIRSTRSLPLLPCPLWPRMVAPDRVLSMGWKELNYRLFLNWIAWIRCVLNFTLQIWTVWNITVYK